MKPPPPPTIAAVRDECRDLTPLAALIFDRFYRIESARNRASDGAGLGLAIVKALTEANGGHIAVTSTVGQGTTFTLSFPRPPHS